MKNPVNWFEIHVADMARAKKFYEGVLGVQLSKLESADMNMWTFPSDQNSYGASGTLVQMAGLAPGGNSTLVYFACADCAMEAARAPQFGGRIEKGKTSIGPHGFFALVIDTEGNRVGLHSMQ